jgi:3-phosphoshikimate 1-carboxyvinyltransferase
MPQAYRLSLPASRLQGTIALEPSKSLSNRALLIRSLCDAPFEIHQLSTSDDTRVLVNMLSSTEETLYAGYAGSSYRFMLARACLFDRPVILDASKQLRSRPIGPLVRALQSLGADIQYLDREGFPPVRITPSADFGNKTNTVSLHAGVSSQYTSALLMIAPLLPNGLVLQLEDDPVSLSYIRMTLSMMKYFGISNAWRGDTITIAHGAYTSKPITIEGDWSSASYYYSMVALADKASLVITGLEQQSLQGDSIAEKLYAQLGVTSTWSEDGLQLDKQEAFVKPESFSHDFGMCPDIAQTVMVTLAGLGIEGKLSGLKTLQFKETDRLTAMAAELMRVKVNLEIREKKGQVTATVKGKAKWKDKAKFETYEDHRMAMSFAPLAVMHPILIKDPQVVSKSYPGFWEDVDRIGFKRETVKV